MDRLYIIVGFVWLVLGMVFGIYLGITDQLQFANSHAHANLLGFVISVFFGLIYRSWPSLLLSRLAWPQFALFQIGSAMLVAGKFDIDSGGSGALAPPGSILVVVGTALMFWMFTMSGVNVPAQQKDIIA